MQLGYPRVLQRNIFSLKRKRLPHFADAELAKAKHSDLSLLWGTLKHVYGETTFYLCRPVKYSKDF